MESRHNPRLELPGGPVELLDGTETGGGGGGIMAGRRGKGEGSIFKRTDGTWCCRIEIGRDASGKRIRKDVYGTTKKAVTDELTRLQGLKHAGKLVADDPQTLGDYLTWWLDNAAVLRVKPKTLEWYRQVCRTHLIPQLGTIKLQRLSPANVQTRLADMARDNCSNRLMEIVVSILHRALVVAVKQGRVIRNVTDAVERPEVPKHEITPMNEEQCGRFLEAAKTDRLYPLYVLALATGCRQGELFGLKWNDIDLKTAMLQVRRTLVELKGNFTTEEPKTDASRRTIDLPQFAVDALWAHKAALLAEGLGGCELVFPDQNGNFLRRSNVTRRSFHSILKAAGLSRIRFHDLRHSTATLLLSAGTHPKIVQERLGHTQIAMTIDIYSHAIPTMGKEAAGKLDSMLKPKPAVEDKKETG